MTPILFKNLNIIRLKDLIKLKITGIFFLKSAQIWRKWLLVGSLTKTADLVSFSILIFLTANVWLSNSVSAVISLTINFLGGYYFTWSHRKPRFISSVGKYIFLNLIIFFVETIIISNFSKSQKSAIFLKIATVIIFTGLSIIINHFWVYQDYSDYMNKPQKIILDGVHCATFVRSEFNPKNVEFITDFDSQFQIGYMKRGPKSSSNEHFHLPVVRNLTGTTEVIYIVKGRATVRLRSSIQSEIVSILMRKGDLVYLVAGIHGFDFKRNTKIIEIKQGPYDSAQDKIFLSTNHKFEENS